MNKTDQIKLFGNLPVPETKQAKRLLPEIPDTGWKLPDYPNLHEKILSIDTETYDPYLLQQGPGWGRGKGHLVGFSIATVDDHSWYFPLRHTVRPEINLPISHTLSWLRDVLRHCKALVGANLLYDLGWLAEEHVAIGKDVKTLDVQYAQALLDERSKVNLDYLSNKYLGLHKVTHDLELWIRRAYGTKDDFRADIWRSPATLVGPYAEADAYLPLRLMTPLSEQLNILGLFDLFLMECKLIPLLLKMRQEGVAIDQKAVDKFNVQITNMIEQEQNQLNNTVGFEANVNAPTDLKIIFKDSLDKLPKTGKTGSPSFAANALSKLNTKLSEQVLHIRHLMKMKSTFTEGYVLDKVVNSRVHCQFHSLKNDRNGARGGRLASSDPNLQNIPSRDKVLAPLIRGFFVPDPGHVLWRKFDYSQIEYRFLIHFGIAVDKVIEQYKNNPSTDYHDLTIALIEIETGIKLDRKPAKTVNFGLIYGMMQYKLGTSLGLSKAETNKLFNAYHAGMPFVRKTMNYYSDHVKEHNEIRTILNRRAEFNFYGNKKDRDAPILPKHEAILKYGYHAEVAGAYKALNRILQGSAADLMKKAMVDCWEAGLFDIICPRLTVHDELDFSDPGGYDEVFKEIKRKMETALQLKVPIKVVEERGSNWGNTKEIK